MKDRDDPMTTAHPTPQGGSGVGGLARTGSYWCAVWLIPKTFLARARALPPDLSTLPALRS